MLLLLDVSVYSSGPVKRTDICVSCDTFIGKMFSSTSHYPTLTLLKVLAGWFRERYKHFLSRFVQLFEGFWPSVGISRVGFTLTPTTVFGTNHSLSFLKLTLQFDEVFRSFLSMPHFTLIHFFVAVRNVCLSLCGGSHVAKSFFSNSAER